MAGGQNKYVAVGGQCAVGIYLCVCINEIHNSLYIVPFANAVIYDVVCAVNNKAGGYGIAGGIVGERDLTVGVFQQVVKIQIVQQLTEHSAVSHVVTVDNG